MGLFDIFGGKPTRQKLTRKIVKFVYDSLQTEKGIRVEDALCLISTIIGERCIDAAGDYSLYDHDHVPGSRIFSDNSNKLLTGDNGEYNWDNLSPDSVFGNLRQNLKHQFPLKTFPKLDSIFENFASGICNEKEEDWGKIPYSVHKDHIPFIN